MKSAGWWNFANLLTISRILLAPLVIWGIVTGHSREALALLVVAGFTDLFDGLVARNTATATKFGQLLDPVADKILLSGVFVALAWIRAVPIWFVAIVFGRDLLLLLASALMMALTQYRKLEPTLYGKGSTVLQILTAGMIVASNASNSESFHAAASLFIWPSAVLTAFSGIHYLARGLYYLWRR